MALRDLKELQERADALSPEEQVQLANYLLSKAHQGQGPRPTKSKEWAKAKKGIESFRGKLANLPDRAFSTDALYD